MNLEDFSGRGLLRRWYLLDGQARCPFDAIDPARLSPAQRDDILAQNGDVRSQLADVMAYEQAERLLAGERPNENVWIEDGEGGRSLIQNPAYDDWLEAEQLVEEVSDDTLALARVRAGIHDLDEQGEPVIPTPDDPGADPLADLPPYDPVPEEISDRQFAQRLAILGVITWPEAIAWASKGDLPSTLNTAINQLPTAGDVRNTAKMLLSSATTYERSHPMTATLGAMLGFDDSQLDDLWRTAAVL